MNPLRSASDYELFLYTLAQEFPAILRSTLTFAQLGASLARVAGELYFDHDVRPVVRKRLLYDRSPLIIDWYGYEVWHGEEMLFWYDPQPHPTEPALQSTHPHHKHTPPDIKHHRSPAPTMSFSRPDLPVLIKEIEDFISDL
jgi:hypothetical protein